MASKQAEAMYGNSPKLERDEKSTKMEVKKPEKKAPEGAEGGEENAGIPVHERHIKERMDMHHKHQHEHYTHDHGKMPNDKKELHERHESEMKELHKKHERELGGKK